MLAEVLTDVWLFYHSQGSCMILAEMFILGVLFIFKLALRNVKVFD